MRHHSWMGTSLCRISKFVREAVYSTLSHQSITMIATIVIIWCESFEYTERPGRPKGGHVLKSWNVGHSWNLCFGEEKKKRKEKRRRKRVHVSWNTYTQMKHKFITKKNIIFYSSFQSQMALEAYKQTYMQISNEWDRICSDIRNYSFSMTSVYT